MSRESSDSLLQASGIGSISVVSGVLCCLGLKVLGVTVLFGGVAATVGITADQTTFLVGGLAGVVLAGILLAYRNFDLLEFG